MATIKEQLKEISDAEKKVYTKSCAQYYAYMQALKIDPVDVEYMETIKAAILVSIANENNISVVYKLVPIYVNIDRYGYMGWRTLLQVTSPSDETSGDYAGSGASYIMAMSDDVHNKILAAIANGDYKLFQD